MVDFNKLRIESAKKRELVQNIQKNAKLVLANTDKAISIKDQDKQAILGVVCYQAIKRFGLENMPVGFLEELSQSIEVTADVLTGKFPNDE